MKPYATAKAISEAVGSRNWVVFARRTRRIVERYGDDVVVLTPRRYQAICAEAERKSREAALLQGL